MKRIIVCLVLLAVFPLTIYAEADKHFKFKGLYVGMKADEAKKLGMVLCNKPKYPAIHDEECSPEPGNKTFTTIGAIPIKNMQVLIEKACVTMIYIETAGAFWDELSRAMKNHYGKPTKISRNGHFYRWDKELEFLSADVEKNKTTIVFAIDTASIREKERSKKAPKDF